MTVAWVDRVRIALGPTGYYHDNKFRKSLQTAVLFEAKRSVDLNAHQLKSYQRKYSLLVQAEHVLNELVQGNVITQQQRDEVLWKTASSQQILDAQTAWKRVKAIERELNALALQVRPFLTSDDGATSHDDAVDQMVRAQYEANPTDYVKAYRDMIGTREWELTHNHLLFTFRLYYRGDQLDPTFPPPNDLLPLPEALLGARSHRNRAAGSTSRGRKHARHERDAGDGIGPLTTDNDEDDDDDEEDEAGAAAAHARATTATNAAIHGAALPPFGGFGNGTASALAAAAARESNVNHGIGGDGDSSVAATDPEADERRRLLREVKDHLEILREFEGVVPAEELAERKRALFLALPPAPPPPLPPTLPAQQQQPPLGASPQQSPSRPRRSQHSPDPNGAKRSRT